MGQYYTPVLTQGNKTTLFGLESNGEWNGLKITEHSWWSNSAVLGICQRIYNKKGRIAWVGDYTDDIMARVVSNDGTEAPMLPWELYCKELHQKDSEGNYVRDENGRLIGLDELPENVKARDNVTYNCKFILDGKVVINLTRKEYVVLDEYFERSVTSDGWCLSPIPLLTSTGGDQGGGDYHDCFIDQDKVGRWAYDELIIKDKLPRYAKDFKKLNVTFSEEQKNQSVRKEI